ncbi:ABC transporter permease [Kaistia dalseonensis]|uniref:Xylitol transport system permease protein n=1 Tax=Kaistia dalseonensis TaxID=410840 RepID=A0ABU0H0T1_9HYPH|nr:ABC transporter permease [Kaistia dalseonensis]MCX5493349.1 ABC transporter permease [Kaistia dalseonensis]MDQ0435906.1 putative xylitol transport system permease protein [Kaistia dalseonensis]
MNSPSIRTAPSPALSQATANLRNILQNQGILIAFILLCVVLSMSSEFFLTWNNWTNIIRQTAINGILAIGVTFVILAGGIDLSVASVMALCGAVAASFSTTASESFIGLVVIAGLATGLTAGLVNGFLVAYLRIPAFVATLGMLSVARGLTFIYTDGRPISNLSKPFLWFGNGTILNIPVPIVALAVVFAVCWFTLRHTVFGRHVYAVGGSERAAITNGVNTRRVTALTYAISGALAAFAGIILTARSTAALPQAGVAYELDAIAAVVIGGTSLAGGRGTLIGTLFGALIIGTINNGLDLLGISSYYQQVVKGSIIVGAVLLDVSRRR